MAANSGTIPSVASSASSAVPDPSIFARSSARDLARRPSVAAAASSPMQRLDQYDRSGRTSPPLQGRAGPQNEGNRSSAPCIVIEGDPPSASCVVIEVDQSSDQNRVNEELIITNDINESRLSEAVRALLVSEGWGNGDLEELRDLEESELFSVTLCEQAVTNKSTTVLNYFSRESITSLQKDLRQSNAKLTTLCEIIKGADEVEFDEPPGEMGEIPFLTAQEREANRDAYFPGGIVSLDENLRQWLSEEGSWSDDYLEMLAGYHGEALASELINLALELEQYEVIQSIPRGHTELIWDEINTALESNEEILEFIDEYLLPESKM